MFNSNKGEMYNANAYYDVIDDFIIIFIFLEMALSSMIYIINDVIMCSNMIHFQDIYI